MENVSFTERLNAALAMADSDASKDEVIAAFENVVRVLTEHNFNQDLEADAGLQVPDRQHMEPVTIATYGKRVAKWIREMISELEEILDVSIRIEMGDTSKITVDSDFSERLAFTASVVGWLTGHIDRLTRKHLKQFNFGRGTGKSESSKYRLALVIEVIGAGNLVREAVENRLNAQLITVSGE